MIRGGLNTASFKGIRRGEVLKADCSGIKQQKHMEIYIDPAMTQNHGNQTLRESDHPQAVIDLERDMELVSLFQSTRSLSLQVTLLGRT